MTKKELEDIIHFEIKDGVDIKKVEAAVNEGKMKKAQMIAVGKIK